MVLKCPASKSKTQYLPELPIYAVQIKEYPETVVGNEKPIHWILLTSHVVEFIEQALQIIQWYRWRWLIEQTFRTLKVKGLNIENSQVERFEALSNLAALALVAAVQVMQLVQARDGNTQQDIKGVFSPIEIDCLEQLNTKIEGKTEKQKNPHHKNGLASRTRGHFYAFKLLIIKSLYVKSDITSLLGSKCVSTKNTRAFWVHTVPTYNI